MVQMKDRLLRGLAYATNTLYPTWFRWKLLYVALRLYRCLPLYPTWFRWKWYKAHLRKFKIKLYIPHGSDERFDKRTIELSSRFFISHMVQMKAKSIKAAPKGPGSFISHMVQMKVLLSIHFSNSWSVFISHMVQMKVGYSSLIDTSLIQLYIPHGSDER